MRILWKYFRKDWWRCFRSVSLEAYNKMLSLHMFFHLNHHRYIMQKNNFVTFTEKHNFTQQVSPSWEFFRAAIIFLKKMKNIKTWMIVKEKHFCYILQLIKFHCLVSFTSWDIWQTVYRNCLLSCMWRHKFWKLHVLLNSSSTLPEGQNKNSRTKRNFGDIKAFFINFKLSQPAFTCSKLTNWYFYC